MSPLEDLREVMAEILHVDPARVTPETRQEDVEAWDSVGHLNLLLALEERFGVAIDIDDFPRLLSVGAIVEYLQGRCPSR